MSESATVWRSPDPQHATHSKLPVGVALTEEGVWRCQLHDGLSLDVNAGVPFALSDSYSRGEDFVATNAPTSDFPFRSQLYWSAKQLDSFGGLVVLVTVSLQTDRLDTRPTLEVLLNAEGCEVANESGAIVSASNRVAVAPFVSDRAECELTARQRSSKVLFAPPFLEKGVIRRARFVVLLGEGLNEPGSVEAALAELSAEPLPLTT